MIALSTNPGLMPRIDNDWMYVKVPVGPGCNDQPRPADHIEVRVITDTRP